MVVPEFLYLQHSHTMSGSSLLQNQARLFWLVVHDIGFRVLGLGFGFRV